MHVTLQLLDEAGDTIATTTTDSGGDYAFTNLAPGTYGWREIPPAAILRRHRGRLQGGQATARLITGVKLLPGVDATDYDFSEMLPVSIDGHVGIAVNGLCGTPDTPPIAGVTMQLLDADGNVIGTTQTDADGNYVFGNLRREIMACARCSPLDTSTPTRTREAPAVL